MVSETARVTSEQIIDLGRLAVERCQTSYQSVTQLVDQRCEAYAIGMIVIVSFVRGMTETMQDDMEEKTGKRSQDDAALAHTVGQMLDGLGVEWKKRSASRTPSKKK
jgi:hypothetical protein